jgi:hypothetical protein
MYRIKVTRYILEGDDPGTFSLESRVQDGLEDIKYVNSFPDHSVLDKSFQTEEEARLAIAKSYRAIDDR